MSRKIKMVGFIVIILAIAAGSMLAQDTGDSDNDMEAPVEENGVSAGQDAVLEGVFTGQADSHTVELKIDGEYRAFGMDKGITFEDIEVGDKIQIKYGENENGRTVISGVESLE